MSLFSPEAVELGAWSPSKVKTGEQCPWKFNRQYVDRLKVPPDKMPELSDSALRVGSAVHYYAECLAKGRDPADSRARAMAKNSLVSDEVDSFESMVANTESFIKRIDDFKRKYDVTEDLVEHRIAISENLAYADFWDSETILRGVVDRTLIIEDKYAIMVDIKTSSFATLKYSELQLEAYALMAFSNWEGLEYVHPVLYFVPDGKFLWSKKVYASGYDFGANNPVVKSINAVSEHVLSDEITPGKFCSWCIYKPLCLEERKVRRAKKKKSQKASAKGR